MKKTDVTELLEQGFTMFRGLEPRLIVQGPDSFDFLNRLSTVKFTKDKINVVVSGCFLTGKSEVISPFRAWAKENAVEFLVEDNFFEVTKTYLEKMHFGEKISISVIRNMNWIEVRSENIPFSKQQMATEEDIGGKKIMIVPAENWGIAGFYMGTSHEEDLLATIKLLRLKQIYRTSYNLLKAYLGNPVSFDFIYMTPILELGWERFIDRNKGCYPGQEVVEKVFTYGRSAKKLITLTNIDKIDTEQVEVLKNSTDMKVYYKDEAIGEWDAWNQFDDGSVFGLAKIRTALAQGEHVFRVGQNKALFKLKT